MDVLGIVPAGVTVNTPPFLAGRDQLTAAETEETEYHLCPHSCGACHWQNKKLSYIGWNIAKYFKTLCHTIASNSIQHGCQACAGCTHMDLNMAAEHRGSVESNASFSRFC